MAENANIYRAVVQQWNASASLALIPISSTRVKQGEVQGSTFPFCELRSTVESHKFSSGPYRLTWYRVELTVYVGQSKSTLGTISGEISAMFDRNIGLPSAQFDDCVCVEVRAVSEDSEVDENDYYGADVNRLRQVYLVLLNETIPSVHAA